MTGNWTMTQRLWVLAVLASLLGVVRGTDAAPGDQSQAKVALHLVSKPSKMTVCEAAPQGGFGCEMGCIHCPSNGSAVLCSGQLNMPYYLYVVLLNLDVTPGISELSFGVLYDSGIGVFDSQLCGGSELPDAAWPGTATGNTVSWDPETDCQRSLDPSDPQGEGHAIAYGLYVYAYFQGSFSVIRHPTLAEVAVKNCSSEESLLDYPTAAGVVGLGVDGFDPCLGNCTGVVPVRASTWGNLKQSYGQSQKR